MEGGFDDIGMGALLGLYDFRYEVLSVIAHARYLENKFGVGPHTISVPRLRPADGAALDHTPYPVSDEDFKKIVAVYRLAVPYAGVVVSTREGAALRDEVIEVGASQISAGSRTDIGGYTKGDGNTGTAQFTLIDPRNLDEMISSIMEKGLLPSLCTACYRSGRTGKGFRKRAEEGEMKEICFSNALLSLMEYLKLHAGKATQKKGLQVLHQSLSSIPNLSLRKKLEQRLEQIEGGEKDIHD
jgi:2-iminoacetate synthase